MRKLLLLAILLAPLCAHAQFAAFSRGPLSGNCNAGTLGLDILNNNVYSCSGSPVQWKIVGNTFPITGTQGALCFFTANPLVCDPLAVTNGSGALSMQTINANAFTIGGSGAGYIDFTGGTGVGNPSSGRCRLYFDTGLGLLNALTSSGGACLGSGSITIPGSSTQLLFNSSGSLGAAANLQWDGTNFFVAATSAATSGGNVSSPLLKIQGNYWNGSSSVPDYWGLQQVAPGTGANRSILQFIHSGITNCSNGSCYTIVFNPDGTLNTCPHDDASSFTTNTVGCWLLAVANTSGTGADLSVINTATTGSNRTRILQEGQVTGVTMMHIWATDPNNNASQQYGAEFCPGTGAPGNCKNYLLYDWNSGNPELYLGGTNAWSGGTSGALKIDAGNGNNVTWYGTFQANAAALFDASASTSSNAFKVPVKSGAVATANGTIAYDSNTNTDVVGHNGTQFTVCTTAGEAGCATAVTANYYVSPWGGNTTQSMGSGNVTVLYAFVPPNSISGATLLYYHVATADNSSNLYDMGIYNSVGSLVCDVGATAGTTLAPSTGDKSISWHSACSLTGGSRYYFATTGNANTMHITGGLEVFSPACAVAPATNSTTTGGQLNSSVTFSSDSPSTCGVANFGVMP